MTCALLLLAFAPPLSAQSDCDGDGGTACGDGADDGGIDADLADDGGIEFIGAPRVRRRDEEGQTSEPIGGMLDGGTVGAYDECSCTTALASSGDLIHLCTESFEPAVCEDFGCNRGSVRNQPCEREGVKLCCEMKARGLNTHLYEDCEHANCESGFREQCRDFGGSVFEGACDQPERPDIIDNSGDHRGDPDSTTFCAVRAPGAPGSAGPLAAMLSLTSVLGLLLRHRRRAHGARRAGFQRTSSPS